MDADATNTLGALTWAQLASGAAPIVVIPIGSCEQHGPHLPLDTDTRIAVAVAYGLARRASGVLVGPAIGVTASGEHQGFPGTLSIGNQAMQTVIVELVRSADWAQGVVLVNGHGGNATSVGPAVAILQSEDRRVLNWWPRIASGDAHAGRTETSLMLAIDPNAVRVELAVAGRTEPLTDLMAPLRDLGVIGVSPNGVLGDPTGANAAEGQALLDAMIGDLARRVDVWRA